MLEKTEMLKPYFQARVPPRIKMSKGMQKSGRKEDPRRSISEAAVERPPAAATAASGQVGTNLTISAAALAELLSGMGRRFTADLDSSTNYVEPNQVLGMADVFADQRPVLPLSRSSSGMTVGGPPPKKAAMPPWNFVVLPET